jgi:catalase
MRLEEFLEAGSNYVIEEIKKRVGDGPVKFKYIAQIAEQGDKLDDPSIAWPDDRKTVELGVIETDNAVADSDAAQRALLFIENAVPPGIEPEDPMINIRSQAYAISFARRDASAAQ